MEETAAICRRANRQKNKNRIADGVLEKVRNSVPGRRNHFRVPKNDVTVNKLRVRRELRRCLYENA